MATNDIFAPINQDSSSPNFLTQSSAAFVPQGAPTSPVTTTSNVATEFNNNSNELRGLNDLRTAYENLNAPFTAMQDEQVRNAGITAGAAFDTPLLQAREEKRQGMGKAIVGAGERGGFMNTQFAGIGALQATEGGTFVGEGGELSRIQDQYSLSIASLENSKQQAIQKAQSAEREYIRTGRRQAYEDVLKFTAEARATAQEQRDAANDKVTALLNAKKLSDEMNKPLIESTKAVQDYAVESMKKYSSGFTDLNPQSISSLTLAEIQQRILGSQEYQDELQSESDKEAGSDYQSFLALKEKGELPSNMTYLGYQQLKATQYGTESSGTKKTSFSEADTQYLLGSGFTKSEIEAIKADVEQYGLDQVKQGLEAEQAAALDKVYGVTTDKLTRGSLSSLFGIEDNDEKSGFKGFFGAGETNSQKLDALMATVEKYRAVGYTDAEILKLMQE